MIHQIYTDNQLRNFTYIIETANKHAFVIDPWDAEQINVFLSMHKLKLKVIINTHEHWDHTKGNKDLVGKHACEVWAHARGEGIIPCLSRSLRDKDKTQLDENTFLEVIDAPGHCQAHLCFMIYHNNKVDSIFTGDILFNAGVGNCHNGGDVNDLYETITSKISTLSDEIKIYPGHEYLENNLKFTIDREPSNKQAVKWLEKYYQADIHSIPLVTTIADEKQINTFLRLDKDEIIKNLKSKPKNNKEVFISLRALRDKW